MTIETLKKNVFEGNEFYFMFKGVRAGLELTLINRKETYDLWWGDIEKQYHSFDAVVNDKVFNGMSIKDLLKRNLIVIDYV